VWMKEVQNQHKEWVNSMYPDQSPTIPAAGMVEEAGELLHAVLALERARKWGFEERYPREKLLEALEDAIGDCAIYFCSYCNSKGWDFHEFNPVADSPLTRDRLTLSVDLVRIAAEFFSRRNLDFARMYMNTVYTISNVAGIEFKQAVLRTWDGVRSRRRR
jgi:NTP pyrophosphatase (non-canonical NTP hydrolase)